MPFLLAIECNSNLDIIMFRYLHYCGMRTNISMLVLSAYSSVLAYGILEEGQFGVKCPCPRTLGVLAQGH